MFSEKTTATRSLTYARGGVIENWGDTTIGGGGGVGDGGDVDEDEDEDDEGGEVDVVDEVDEGVEDEDEDDDGGGVGGVGGIILIVFLSKHGILRPHLSIALYDMVYSLRPTE